MVTRHPSDPIMTARGIVNRFGRQEVHDDVNLDIEREKFSASPGVPAQENPFSSRPWRGCIDRIAVRC
jgi:hypothetical protein